MSIPGEGLSGETVDEPTGHQLLKNYARATHRNERIRRGDPVEAGQAVMRRVLSLASREKYAGLDLGQVDPQGRPLTTEDYFHYLSGEHGDAAVLIKQFVDSDGQDVDDLARVQGFLDDNLGGHPDVVG